MEWSPVYSPATILALLGWLTTIGGGLVVLGMRTSDLRTVIGRADKSDLRIDRLEASLRDSREDCEERFGKVRDELERYEGATAGRMALMDQGAAERQIRAHEVFATKRDMEALENRTTKVLDQISETLVRIEGRIANVSDTVMKTLAQAKLNAPRE